MTFGQGSGQPTPASETPTLIDVEWLRKVYRGHIVGIAVIGLILGVIGLVFPGPTLFTIAILFGSFLVASGIFRIVSAVVAHEASTPIRWLSAVMGIFVVIAGILTLAHPFASIVATAFVIGIGWVLDGVVDFMLGLRGAVRPRWLGFVSGIVSIAAGVAMFVLPAAGIASLVLIGSALLIAVSLTTLLTLPRRPKRP
jgi:uncharacterized membrane protein HdeD (DUF308 family)